MFRPANVIIAIAAIACLGGAARPAAAAAGCPATAPSSVRSPTPGARQELVPPAAVSVTVCRYRGLNDPNPSYVNRLVGSATVDNANQVRSLVEQFNALPPLPQGVTARACPADDGSSMLALFDYSNSPADLVLVRPTGCSSATNGYIAADMAFNAGQRLRTELQHVTGCPGSIDASFCNSDPAIARDATVAGYVRTCGGPAPGRCFVEAPTICQGGCVTADRVQAVDATGRRVAIQNLRQARFHLSLEPGRYTIELLGDGKQIHGRVMQRKRVTARAHRTTGVVFFFAFP